MRVDRVGGARMNNTPNVERVQRRVQNQPQMQPNRMNRNRVERTIDRMAKLSNEMKNNATKRMKVFYKALRKSMFDFMG